MIFCFCGSPHWIQDGKLNTLDFFCLYGCWFSGLWFSNLWTLQMLPLLKKRCHFTLTWLLDLGNTSLRIKTGNVGLFALYPCYCSCVADPWLTVGYYWGNSLSHLMLIIEFGLSSFGPKVTWRTWVSTPKWVPVGFDHNGIYHLATDPNLQNILFPDLHTDFPKCGNAHNTQEKL